MDNLRSQEPSKPGVNVMVHGDPERAHMEKCDRLGGIEYHINQIKMAVCVIYDKYWLMYTDNIFIFPRMKLLFVSILNQ